MRPSARLKSSVLILCGGLLAATPAMAQGMPERVVAYPDDAIQQMMDMARNGLADAKKPDGTPFGPESAKDKAQPLLELNAARAVVDAGALSALANHCGLNWQDSNFANLMTSVRLLGLPPKNAAYVALLHGVAMGVTEQGLKADPKPCTPGMRDRVSEIIRARLPKTK